MKNEPLFFAMYRYYANNPHQIQHLVKVHSFALQIGNNEGLAQETLHILETAAIVHDIGIKNAIEKHGSGDGPYQEQEGPPEARRILKELGYPQDLIERVCFLVGNHHSYQKIDGIDFQILVEADFLVNIHEGNMSKEATLSVLDKIFRTRTGKEICRMMYLVSDIDKDN